MADDRFFKSIVCSMMKPFIAVFSFLKLACCSKMASGERRKNPTLICVPIIGDSVEQMLVDAGKAKASGADLVEIRLDSLKSFSPHEDLKIIIKDCPLPTLFTYRFVTLIFDAYSVDYFIDLEMIRISASHFNFVVSAVKHFFYLTMTLKS